MDDELYMRQALALACLAEGDTSPNPMVGAVIVSADGEVVGEGYHHKAGQPHAEINALKEAKKLARGGTIYVTLEPCSHFGRTGPCCEAIRGDYCCRTETCGCGGRRPEPQGCRQRF